MKAILIYGCLSLLLLCSCGGKHSNTGKAEDQTPQVKDNGKTIMFPNEASIHFFETETIEKGALDAQIIAPAKIAATVLSSVEGANQNIILFENPELAGNYTQLIQHLVNINQIQNNNIKQKKIELERMRDLVQHGAATGKDLLDAQTALAMEETNLANERAAIIEHETKLKIGGFQPEMLRSARPGTAYIICDIPESQIGKIREGSDCVIEFTSFPNEKFKGRIDDVADMIDESTRMLKLRVSLNNNNGKLKAGMYATVTFGVSEGNTLSVNKSSLVTIQARNYVFVKTAPLVFSRQEVTTGSEMNDRVVIYTGLSGGEQVAVKGAMQLKGLSFGY